MVLTVHGPPRVNNDNKHLFLIEGADATIEVEFCGAPLPKQTWQIESVESRVSLVSEDSLFQIHTIPRCVWPQVAGTSHDMFAVDKERAAATSNCYISTLHILSIDQHHARDYVLRLENEHGEEVRTVDANISDVEFSASKSSIRRFIITEKAPTRAFSWLKAATTAFTFKTLC